MRKTWETPFINASARLDTVRSCIGSADTVVTGGKAKQKESQVNRMKGKVRALMPKFFRYLFINSLSHGEIAERIMSEAHINGVLPKNVGRAHPMSTPLYPQRPWSASSSPLRRRYAGMVDAMSPTIAPTATMTVPYIHEPIMIPARNNVPVFTLSMNIT